MPLEHFVGSAYVAEHEGSVSAVDAASMLRRAEAQGNGCEKRILIKGNAEVSPEAAETFAAAGILLLGNESQSVGPEDAPMAVHKALLGQDIVLLEGIRLQEVPGCLPLKRAPSQSFGAGRLTLQSDPDNPVTTTQRITDMLDFTKTLTADKPLIHPSCVVTDCSFGEYVELGDNCIAAESHIGSYTYLFGHNDIYNCTLGKFNSIATGVRINPVQHPMRERVASHHLTYRAAHYGLGEDDPGIINWRRQLTVTTGHDVWIGHNAIIMGGVSIANGAVIAAGAVVTHDVAPYEIVGGVPARHIGWRYNEETIAALQRICWWDWSHETLKERLRDFNDVPQFIKTYDVKSEENR